MKSTLVIFTLAATVTLTAACSSRGVLSPCSRAQLESWPIPAQWVVEEVSLQEAEERHTQREVPFGLIHDQWMQLRTKTQTGDRLIHFDSHPDLGSSGYLLIRDCRMVDIIITTQYE